MIGCQEEVVLHEEVGSGREVCEGAAGHLKTDVVVRCASR